MTVATQNGVEIVRKVSFQLRRGRIVGLVGESGSGKTTLAGLTLGYTAPGLEAHGDWVHVADHDMLTADAKLVRKLRGRTIAYVPQDPSTALNPTRRLNAQISEMLALHRADMSKAERESHIASLMREVDLPEDSDFRRRYPHQLSGGQLQRFAIAMAYSCDPEVIVLDEPTTGLDVIVQQGIIELIRRVCTERNTAALYISHDLEVVAVLTDDIMVMVGGEIIEAGPTSQVTTSPRDPIVRQLLDAVPSRLARTAPRARENPSSSTSAQLATDAVCALYGQRMVTEDVSLDLQGGRCLALVGESGSGKTTTGRIIAGLHRDYRGEVLLGSDVMARDVRDRSRIQRQQVQYIFQNPYGSLNPRRRVLDIVRKPSESFHGREKAAESAVGALRAVRVGEELWQRYPHELSGGQRQRVAIARALAVDPSFLVCDEITASLDVSVQASIVALLRSLMEERDLGVLFITHQLALARFIAHDVAVLKDGRIVERQAADDLFACPTSDYAKALIGAIPATL
ncbi:ABC transporter ATP-binding protein [Microbacterium sp.]|uniref:ABC transporter ATP-binding protein n=1 Tax=Microbacterium sp. TaxID=51671 RepID=UPI0039E4639B